MWTFFSSPACLISPVILVPGEVDTVLLILPVLTVLHVITHQAGGDTLTVVTTKLSGLLHTQVEVESSDVIIPFVTAGTTREIPPPSSDREVWRPVHDSDQAGVETEIVKFPPPLLN